MILALLLDLSGTVTVEQEVEGMGLRSRQLVADDEEVRLDIDDGAVEAVENPALRGVVGLGGTALDVVEALAGEELGDLPAEAFDLVLAGHRNLRVLQVLLVDVEHHGAVADAAQ